MAVALEVYELAVHAGLEPGSWQARALDALLPDIDDERVSA